MEERYSIAVALISYAKSKMKCETNVSMYKEYEKRIWLLTVYVEGMPF